MYVCYKHRTGYVLIPNQPTVEISKDLQRREKVSRWRAMGLVQLQLYAICYLQIPGFESHL